MKTVSQNCSIFHPYTVKKNYCNVNCKTQQNTVKYLPPAIVVVFNIC